MAGRNAQADRRRFLKTGAALASGLALPRWFAEEIAAQTAAEEPRSPNGKPGILLVGCGGRGRGVARAASRFGNILAVCDVDANRAGETAAELKAEAKFGDFRKALAHKGVEIVVNGTPDHWHTLVNLHALRSGKDVYSEKPLTLTIDEGKRLVAAVRDTKRILQTGSQQRSDERFRLACELVRNGRIGRLEKIDVRLPTGRTGGPFEARPVPPELDWNLWLGQAPQVDYVPERCHVHFRFWYDYSGGTLTDWGAHHMDIAQWGAGTDRSGPVSVRGEVLESPIPGGFTAAAHYRLDYTYASGVTLSCRNVVHENYSGSTIPELKKNDETNGVRFEGTGGWIFVNREKLEASRPEILSEELPAGSTRLYVSTDHMGNFFDCVRSRQAPICDAEIGHRSVSVCHLGVIALRTGRKLAWDPEKEQFVDDAEANGQIARAMRKPWSYENL